MCDSRNMVPANWVLVFFPDSDPDPQYEFEIVNKSQLSLDSEIRENSVVTVNYGSAKVQAIVVEVSDDREKLEAEFTETIKYFKEKQLDEVKKLLSKKHRKNKIKTDEETVSEDYKSLRQEIAYLKQENEKLKQDNEEQKRQIEQLQNKCKLKIELLTELEIKCDLLKHEMEKKNRQQDELSFENSNLKRTFTDVETDVQSIIKKLRRARSDPSEQDTERAPLSESKSLGNKENSEQMVQIGSGGTRIPSQTYNAINWTNHSSATRKLLITLFGRTTLATHSLTGKPSPAFISSSKQAKTRLDPIIISDIVEIVMKKCHVSESQVRSAITTKCADENKMQKKKLKKEN